MTLQTPIIVEWLQMVLATQPPADEIVAFNIGLFEGVTASGERYCAYLSGSTTFTETSNTWAIDPAYYPTNFFLDLDDRPTGDNWEACLAVVKEAVSGALSNGLLQGTPLASALAVTVGFDDGDLHRIR
jgi:hypothetical protein